MQPALLIADPSHFDVRYRINPWMQPEAWTPAQANAARAAAAQLRVALVDTGATVTTVDSVAGLPDLVFLANAAVVLDGRVLLARFRHPERRAEEPLLRTLFERLRNSGVVREIHCLPDGVTHEGAGDAIWDANRTHFWGGFGQRSSVHAISVIERVFGQEVVPLELASARFYHLDTCFCPLSGGEVLYYPPAFTPAALAAIHARVPHAQRIEASAEEAAAFCVNAVNLGNTIVLARAPPSLRAKLASRGYQLREVDLAPFILSGGAAYCMTLRLDLTSGSARVDVAAG